MKGEFNGLQALFLRECPYAYYVHCYAHRLQLALVAAAKDVVPITQFFQKLFFIVNTVDSSQSVMMSSMMPKWLSLHAC